MYYLFFEVTMLNIYAGMFMLYDVKASVYAIQLSLSSWFLVGQKLREHHNSESTKNVIQINLR